MRTHFQAALASAVAWVAAMPVAHAQTDAAQIDRGAQALPAEQVEIGVYALSLLAQAGNAPDIILAYEAFPAEVQRDPRAVAVYAESLRALNRRDDAAAALRNGLVHSPDATRLRLLLGRVLYQDKRFGAAALQFRLALAGSLPDEERTAARQYLAAIESDREWVTSLSLAAAPNSNINGATDARQVELFGLPFDINPDGRRTSGVGLVWTGSVERRVRINQRLRLAAGGALYFRDHENVQFDDLVAVVRAGPDFLVGDTRVQVRAMADRRWFGGRAYAESWGLDVNARRPLSHQLLLDVGVQARSIDELSGDARDGDFLGATAGLTRYSNAGGLETLFAGAGRHDARADHESHYQARLGAGAYREFRNGLGLYVEGAAAWRLHDARDPLFETRRRDLQLSAQARLTRRDWVVFGGTPFVAIHAFDTSSSQVLYDAVGQRIEFGFTATY